MTPEQAGAFVARMNAMWPPKTTPTAAEVAEWMSFLRVFDAAIAVRALTGLRDQLPWRPSMAAFRSAYKEAAAAPADSEVRGGEALRDLYGSSETLWVFCWRCDMAISLAELSTDPHYRPGRGLCHRRCPEPGTAPIMPAAERLERAEKRLGKPATRAGQ
jgi:hypothetical protein